MTKKKSTYGLNRLEQTTLDFILAAPIYIDRTYDSINANLKLNLNRMYTREALRMCLDRLVRMRLVKKADSEYLPEEGAARRMSKKVSLSYSDTFKGLAKVEIGPENT